MMTNRYYGDSKKDNSEDIAVCTICRKELGTIHTFRVGSVQYDHFVLCEDCQGKYEIIKKRPYNEWVKGTSL
jgi:hydrogenase maturation factor HypF (carbamoyltransferase family)